MHSEGTASHCSRHMPSHTQASPAHPPPDHSTAQQWQWQACKTTLLKAEREGNTANATNDTYCGHQMVQLPATSAQPFWWNLQVGKVKCQ